MPFILWLMTGELILENQEKAKRSDNPVYKYMKHSNKIWFKINFVTKEFFWPPEKH